MRMTAEERKDNNISALLKTGAHIINFGMVSFYDDLLEQKTPAVQVDWAPKTASKQLLSKLKMLKTH